MQQKYTMHIKICSNTPFTKSRNWDCLLKIKTDYKAYFYQQFLIVVQDLVQKNY